MKRLCLTALLALAACAADPTPGAIEVSATPIVFYPDAPEQNTIGRLTYRGGLVLTSDDERFGGLSALEVRSDGHVIAISDSAYWVTGDLIFAADGTLTGFSQTSLAPMLGPLGNPLTGNAADAEGLTDLGSGRYAVSFEREHRIAAYDIGPGGEYIATARPESLPSPQGIERLRNNGGVEALTRTDDGMLALVEYPIIDGRPHTIWHLPVGRTAEAHDYNAASGFGLTGADALDADRIVLVERYYSRSTGNRIRIAVTDEARLAAGTAPDILAEWGVEANIDNFEGIAVAQIGGETRLFIVSDNNYSDGQRTLLFNFSIDGL